MSDVLLERLCGLIGLSVEMWAGTAQAAVRLDDSGTITLASDAHHVTVERAPEDMPFRWVVTCDGRKRTAASVTGVLRVVRQHITPGYEPFKLTVTPPTLAAS